MQDEERAKQLFFEALDDADRKDVVSAERKLREALKLVPDRASIHTNLAFILFYQNRFEETRQSARRATELDANDAEAWLLLGSALVQLGGFKDAVEPFRRAAALTPQDAEAQAGWGQALFHTGRFAEAAAAYEAALRIEPGFRYLLGELATAKLNACSWIGLDEIFAGIRVGINRPEPVSRPWPLLAMPMSAALQLRCATSFSGDDFPVREGQLWSGKRYGHSRVRVAYLSPDFREHAVSHLCAGVFEQHDRSRFETIGVALGGNDNSPIRNRISTAFEHFVDGQGRTEVDIASLLLGMEVDIAVDLAGVTFGSRPRVFAMRPAPVQVNYLGFPGTMGSQCMDYIIADRFVIPEASQQLFIENVAYVPECFQPNDDKRPLPAALPSRASCGLPESGFVFCSFNGNQKILPEVFDVWMRILSNVPGSVLWLAASNEGAENNLRREATLRGIDPQRLVLAVGVAHADHITRYPLADLSLDTFPFSGGATASDSLWAGVPIVTCAGETFASRMAGSLLRTIGLPELVVDNLADYEALALALARDPARLAGIRQRLAAGRVSSPLYDTKRFTRHLEAAYLEMWQRAERGLGPASFSVPAVAAG